MARILILEDDKLFNETLEDFLQEEGHAVHCALDPYSALDLSYAHLYDVYLFDVNLPYENGFTLLEKLRQGGDETPCIFITSKNDKASLKEGFIKGGDDYMQKPVDLDELSLRIQALLRRRVRSQSVQIEGYRFDVMTKQLFDASHAMELSTKAGELLLVLLEAKGSIVQTCYIKERLWSAAEEASDGALRVYVTQLKKYFPSSITNIRGIGYQLTVDTKPQEVKE